MEETTCPLRAINGRVIIKQLPPKPSKLIELVTIDRADETEGIVVALSPYRHGWKILGEKSGKRKGAEVMTDQVFPHDVKLGDRVLFKPKYSDDDRILLNYIKYRSLDPREILAVVEPERPEGFDNPITGEKTPDDLHQMLTEKLSTQTVDTSVKSQILTP